MFIISIKCVIMFHLAPLSDERAQQIIDKALQESSVDMRNIISVLTGLMGSGKTCLLSRIFNRVPPNLYTSTGIAEQSFRGFFHHIGTISSWEIFTNQKILEYLADLFHQDLPPVDMIRLAKDIVSLDLPAGADSLPLLASTSTSSSVAHSPFSTTAASTASPNPASPTTMSNTSQSIMSLVKIQKDSQSPTTLELIHMIDTGGQPEYMENMPGLIHSCHLAVLVMNLLYDVDDHPSIHYHEEGKEYKRVLRSQYSNRQIIQKLAATLQAKRFSLKKGHCFRLFSVATHRDCVPESELSTRVEAYHQALKSILLPANDNELIFYSEDEIPFVLNLKEPDSTDIDKLNLIRQKVRESGVGEVVKTPGAFLIFEQELAEYATKAGRGIVSLDECLEVEAKLKMSYEMVISGLIFLNRQFTFLYFRSVLPNLVFVQPQVPLDCINAIVQFNYKVPLLKGVTKNLISSLRDGIITEEILSHQHLSKCFIPNLYEPHHAIDLLCHTLTLAPLSHEPQAKSGNTPNVENKPSPPVKREREKKEYLMMSLRQPISNKGILKYIPVSSVIAPLVIQFTKNCVPLSCFSRMISCLLSMYDWKLSRADDGSPECLASNIVSLYDSQLPVQIILRDATSHLEIHVCPDEGFTCDISPKICFQIHENIFSAIKQVFDSMHLEGIEILPAFICPCSKSSIDTHFSSLHSSIDSKKFLRCSETGKNAGPVEKKQRLWLDTPVTETMKPSLPKLLDFNIPEKVGSNYYNFGIFLLNDEDGCLLDVIENDCLQKCERIIRKILSKWIQGRGKPVTWSALIEVLRRCNLNELADHIHEKTH